MKKALLLSVILGLMMTMVQATEACGGKKKEEGKKDEMVIKTCDKNSHEGDHDDEDDHKKH